MKNRETLSTDFLIDHLSDSVPERRKISNPLAYFFIGWLVVSVLAVLIYLNVFLSARFDLMYRMTDVGFLTSVGAMFLGSCFFAYGALANAIPGNQSISDRIGVGCTVVWVGLIIITMIMNFDGLVAGKVYLRFDLKVFAHMVVASVIPLALLWALVLRLSPVKPKRIAMSACVASFMLSTTMLRFFYVHLYGGADCSYSLFIWMVVPLVVASVTSWSLIHPMFQMKSIDKHEFLNRQKQDRVENTALST